MKALAVAMFALGGLVTLGAMGFAVLGASQGTELNIPLIMGGVFAGGMIEAVGVLLLVASHKR